MHRIDLPAFEEHLLGRALYPHVRPVRKLLQQIPDYFTSDHEFIRSVGDLRSRRFFHAEAGEYSTHASNRGLLRRFLRLRVSAERTRRIMEETWGSSESNPPIPPGDVSAD